MKRYTIYTDGSHLKHTSGRLGVGGVMVDESGNIVSEFSEEIDLGYLKSAFGTSDVSNPTCEMLANLYALLRFRDSLKGCDSVIMKADYIGVQKFNTGEWRAKEPYIKKIKELTEKEVKSQGLTGKLEYAWVKGHQKKSILDPDARWNDYVDKLAKGEKK